jgi:hypothetical protein
MKSKKDKVYLKSKVDERKIVKFSIQKDGRAAFTSGWTEFAMANNITPGSLVAFIFGTCSTGVDIEIDVLKRGE